jgi:glycerophosphoryl diester phosphodiesterase
MLVYEIEDKEKGGFKPNIPFELFQKSVDGIGISKALLLDQNGAPSGIVKTAHAYDMKVHVWTIRDDMVPTNYDNSTQEMKAVFALGVDGVFADFPDTARSLVNTLELAGKVISLE